MVEAHEHAATLTVSIPRIETDRLLLREYRRADFDAYAESFTDPIVHPPEYGVVDRREAWRRFMAAMGMWIVHGVGSWAVELFSTREVVGSVWLLVREERPDVEIGWVLYRRFWGNGYATEAAAAALDFAFAVRRVPRVIAHIEPRNTASIRVSQRLGMRYEGEAELFGATNGLYVLEPAL